MKNIEYLSLSMLCACNRPVPCRVMLVLVSPLTLACVVLFPVEADSGSGCWPCCWKRGSYKHVSDHVPEGKTVVPAPNWGWVFEHPLKFFAIAKKTAARSAAIFLHSCLDNCSATFLKILGSGHQRSGHQVRSSDPQW